MISQRLIGFLNKSYISVGKELIFYAVPIVIIFLVFNPISISPVDSSGQESLKNYHSTSSMMILWAIVSFLILFYFFMLKKINLDQLSLLIFGNIIGLFSVSQWLILKNMHFFWSNGTPDISEFLNLTNVMKSNLYIPFTNGGYPPLYSFLYIIYDNVFSLIGFEDLKYFSIFSIIFFAFIAFKIFTLNFTPFNSSIIVASLVLFSTPWEKVYPEFSIILFLGLIFCIDKYKYESIKLILLGISFGLIFQLYYSPFYFSIFFILYLIKSLQIKSLFSITIGFLFITLQSISSIIITIIRNYYLKFSDNLDKNIIDSITNISFVGDYFSYPNAFISNFGFLNYYFDSNVINLIIIFLIILTIQFYDFKDFKANNIVTLVYLIFSTFIFKLLLSVLFHFSGNLNLFPRADNHLVIYFTALLFIILLKNLNFKSPKSFSNKESIILILIYVILLVKLDSFYFNIFPKLNNPAWVGIYNG